MNPGDLITGKYRLVRQIGEGAMGVVWSAINESTTREVALKLVLRSTDELRHRLLREARACGKLSHRNIIEIYDVGQAQSGDPFLVMQLLSGETVAELLDRQRRLEPPLAAQIGRDVARALAAAHAASIIHRDLKPANIFLHHEAGTEGTVVKVLDFGVSKNLAAVDSMATVQGGLVGSPAFMSPEQVRMVPDLDHRTDIWSLGVVLFKMLTGVLPFQGTAQDAVQQIVAGEIPVVSRFVRFVDPGLVQVVSRCMERDRGTRIQSAAELAELLAPYASSEASRGMREMPQSRAASIPSSTMGLRVATSAPSAPNPSSSMPATAAPGQAPSGASAYARSGSSAALPSVVPAGDSDDDDAETLRFNPAMAAGLPRSRQGQTGPAAGTFERPSQGGAQPAGAAGSPAGFSAPYGGPPATAPPATAPPMAHPAMPQPMAPTQKLPPDSPWSAPPAAAPSGGLGGTAPMRAPAGATPLPSQRARDSGDYPRGSGTIRMVAPTKAELAAALPARDSATTTAAVVQSGSASRPAHSGAGWAHSGAASGHGPQWRVAVAIAVISMLVVVSAGLIYKWLIAQPAVSSAPASGEATVQPQQPVVGAASPPDTANARAEREPIAPASGATAAGPVGSAAPPVQPATPMNPPPTTWGPQSQRRPAAVPSAAAPDAPAILHISSVPSSRVVLDGKLLGESPMMGLRVSPGEHRVRFVHHELGTRSLVVTVKPGETKQAAVRF